MSSAFHSVHGPVVQSSIANINRQLQRASGLDIDVAQIQQPPVNPQLNVIAPPARIFYPPYNIGYLPGTTIVFVTAATANPPPVHNQFAITSAHPYQQFSVTDLPEILFRLEPFEDRFIDFNDPNADIPVPMMHDSTSRQPIRNSRGAYLRYFSFLPRYIARDVPGCLLEFWFRLDYRLEMNDIRMRMEADDAGKFPLGNALNMRRNRFRANVKADAWGKSRNWPVKPELSCWTDLPRNKSV